MERPAEIASPVWSRFVQYHKQNRWLWAAFEKRANRLRRSGVCHFGAKAIFEVIRFFTAARGRNGFKLNNNYAAYYARVYEVKYSCRGFFETRQLRGNE